MHALIITGSRGSVVAVYGPYANTREAMRDGDLLIADWNAISAELDAEAGVVAEDGEDDNPLHYTVMTMISRVEADA